MKRKFRVRQTEVAALFGSGAAPCSRVPASTKRTTAASVQEAKADKESSGGGDSKKSVRQEEKEGPEEAVIRFVNTYRLIR